MGLKQILIHIVLLIFTAGVGNVIYFAYTRGWSKKRIALAGVIAFVAVGVAIGAGGDTNDEPSVEEPTTTPTEQTESSTETSTEPERLSSGERFDLHNNKADSLTESKHVAETITVNAHGNETTGEFTYYSLIKKGGSANKKVASAVAINYASIVEVDTFGTNATVDIYNEDTDFVGRITIERGFAEEYNNGQISKQEYVDAVMQTYVEEKPHLR